MNLELTNVLIDGLFARKVIKTIKSKDEYNENTEYILKKIQTQMDNTISGITESTNYETSTENSLKHLNAYGNAITIIQLSPELIQKNDCVETIATEIIEEINSVLTTKIISPESLPKTLHWYEKIRKYSLNQGSRFNIQPTAESAWGINTKF